jgi:hypothetical protein
VEGGYSTAWACRRIACKWSESGCSCCSRVAAVALVALLVAAGAAAVLLLPRLILCGSQVSYTRAPTNTPVGATSATTAVNLIDSRGDCGQGGADDRDQLRDGGQAGLVGHHEHLQEPRPRRGNRQGGRSGVPGPVRDPISLSLY